MVPELRAETEQLYAVHRRLADFLLGQRQLRLRDFEAWLDSDRDAGYMQLWQQHCRAVQGLEERLVRSDLVQGVGAEWSAG